LKDCAYLAGSRSQAYPSCWQRISPQILCGFFCGVSAAMLIIPGFVYVYVIVIWHWKDRYRGKHSDLWGALILIETSGWMKLVYIFRHIVPDMYHTGRYRLESPQPVS
jgi:hypothetical protein